jgi:two-component system response regulator MtrA
MSKRLRLVEDDPKIAREVILSLKEEGFEVDWICDGAFALSRAPAGEELLILDLMLPGASGLDILQAWRAKTDAPVIVLSAKQDAGVKVRALELGADDYLTKPFWPGELKARVVARLRRPSLERFEQHEHGPLRLDGATRVATLDGRPLDLTRVEFDLLHALVRRAGAAIARGWMVLHVLDPDREGNERTLDVHVSRLRRKLGPCGGWIATVWGVGYRFEVPDDPARGVPTDGHGE